MDQNCLWVCQSCIRELNLDPDGSTAADQAVSWRKDAAPSSRPIDAASTILSSLWAPVAPPCRPTSLPVIGLSAVVSSVKVRSLRGEWGRCRRTGWGGSEDNPGVEQTQLNNLWTGGHVSDPGAHGGWVCPSQGIDYLNLWQDHRGSKAGLHDPKFG